MRPSDIIAGSAFRTALAAVAIVAVAFAAAGWLAYGAISRTIYAQISHQLVEELLLFRQVGESQGRKGLVDAIRQLESPEVAGDRMVALMEPDGSRLAGNLDVAPQYADLSRELAIVETAAGEKIAVSGARFESLQLVVGRDNAPAEATLRTLVRALLAAFLVISAAVMAAGWILSRRSLAKLTRISETMERVGRGDTGARIGPLGDNGQIDRIAQLIDGSLGRLSAMTESSQNTIRAIAHDLRTPLGRTLIHLEDAAAAPADQRDRLLSQAKQELDRLGAIFDTVLRISTLETSFDRTGFDDVDLTAVIADTVPLFEADIAEKGQTVEVVAGGPVVIRGDGQALRQLLVNLVANANRHAGEGARIVVRAGHLEGGALLSVCDDGVGIAPDEREAVLKPFTRLDASRSVEGTGLGLALVNAIAFRHGAGVELDDNEPGLCVRVRFTSASGTDPAQAYKDL